jgi:6-phosphogluconolactonase
MAVKPPGGGTARITLTSPVINNAKRIIFLVSGEAKAGALKLALGPDPADIPARITRAAKGAVQWIVDKAAASEELSED